MGGLQGRKRGRPSSIIPVNLPSTQCSITTGGMPSPAYRLQMGFTPRSGRLFPTLTTIVAFLPLAERKNYSERSASAARSVSSTVV